MVQGWQRADAEAIVENRVTWESVTKIIVGSHKKRRNMEWAMMMVLGCSARVNDKMTSCPLCTVFVSCAVRSNCWNCWERERWKTSGLKEAKNKRHPFYFSLRVNENNEDIENQKRSGDCPFSLDKGMRAALEYAQQRRHPFVSFIYFVNMPNILNFFVPSFCPQVWMRMTMSVRHVN